jgi:hypothetical protein
VLVVGLDSEHRSGGLSEIPIWSWTKIRSILIVILVIVLGFGLIGLVVGLVIGHGLVGGLVVGLGAGHDKLREVLSYKELENRDRTLPNQGIQRSGRNGLLVGLIVGLLSGLTFGLAAGRLGGLVVGLENGGEVWVQHMMLRLVLWRVGHMPAPWQYIAFLDDAVDQLLLRKVGVGYVFRHRLLQDYFTRFVVVPPHSGTSSP